MRLHRTCKIISGRQCICLGDLTHGGLAWLIADKNYSLAMLVKLDVLCVGQSRQHWGVIQNLGVEEVDFVLLVARPFFLTSSTELFADLYDKMGHRDDSAPLVPPVSRFYAVACVGWGGEVMRVRTNRKH